jgi:hypothetical protein
MSHLGQSAWCIELARPRERGLKPERTAAERSGAALIYRDGGRWRGAVSLGYDSSGNRVRKKVSGRTRAETVDKLRKLRQQVDTGVVPNDRLMVGAFLDRWLAVNVPGTVAESTEDDYNDTVRLHLQPALGRKQLTRLTVADVDKLWKGKREAGYSANSVRIMRTAITKDVYGHLVEGHTRAAAQSMSGLLFGTPAGTGGSQRGSQRRTKSPSGPGRGL